MEKFCGRCGARLDEATGLCPHCDAKKTAHKDERLSGILKEVRKESKAGPRQDAPVSRKETREKRKIDKKTAKKEWNAQKKAARKAEKKAKWEKLSFGQKARKIVIRLLLCLVLIAFFAGVVFGVSAYLGRVDIPTVEGTFHITEIFSSAGSASADNQISETEEDFSAITKAYLQSVTYEIIELDEDNRVATLEVSVPNLTQLLPQIVTEVLAANEGASYKELLQTVRFAVGTALIDENTEKITATIDLPVEESNGEYIFIYNEQWDQIVFGSLEDMYIEYYRTMIGGLIDEIPE